MSRSTTSIPCASRKLLALRQVVQVGFQKKIGFGIRLLYGAQLRGIDDRRFHIE
jgi:hypothetical protein